MRLALAAAALGVLATGATTSAATAAPSHAATDAHAHAHAHKHAASHKRVSAGRGYVPGTEVRSGAPVHGMILADCYSPLAAVLGDIPRLAADGVNLVSIYVCQYMDSATSTTMHAGPLTPSDAELETAISLAHANGMAVELAPTVWTTLPYVWRGAFQPSNVDQWFASYRTMMNHYASLAEANGVELLAVGSEYSSLDGYASQWRRIVKEVRSRFSGLTTYMAVTQHIATLTWWSSVDLIGVSPYYYLSGALQPSYDELRAAWEKRWFPFIKRISEKYDRPVLFNEIGYLSALGTTAAPYKSSSKELASEQIQANAYAALLDAASTQSWLRGIIFYRWSPPVAAPVDKSYTPRDKLAECVMAQHWAAPDAPVGLDGQPMGCVGATLAQSSGQTG